MLVVPVVRTWDLHLKQQQQQQQQQQRPPAVTPTLIHSRAESVAPCSQRAHTGVYVNGEGEVEEGLRGQQLAWELRGHSAGIDFINRLSQHSGSGCRRAPLETQNVGQERTGRTDRAHLHRLPLTA